MKTIGLMSVGRKHSLVEAFRSAASNVEPEVGDSLRVVALDASPIGVAVHPDVEVIQVPPAEDRYVDEFVRLINKHKIDLIVPLCDHDLVFAGMAKRYLMPETVLSSLSNVAEVLTDKFAQVHKTSLTSFFPPTVKASALYDESFVFTDSEKSILKPIKGNGSNNQYVITSDQQAVDIANALDFDLNDYVAQEIVEGFEYTVHCLMWHGKLIEWGCYERIKVCDGRSVVAGTYKPDLMDEFLKQITKDHLFLNMHGVVCFQVIDDCQKLHLIEINGRIGSGYPLLQAAGSSILQNAIRLRFGMKPRPEHFKTGVVAKRYEIFLVDFKS